MGHRNTSCDPHLHPSHQATNARLPHAKRPPPGGYVQTTKPPKWVLASTYSDWSNDEVGPLLGLTAPTHSTRFATNPWDKSPTYLENLKVSVRHRGFSPRKTSRVVVGT